MVAFDGVGNWFHFIMGESITPCGTIPVSVGGD